MMNYNQSNNYEVFMKKWMNETPRDWNIQKIKNISNIFGRIGFRGYTVKDLVDEGEGAVTLGPPNIENQHLILDKKNYLSWFKYNESPEIKIYNGDIVLVKTASVGKVALIENLNEATTINPQLVVFKKIKIFNKYFYYVLISSIIQNQIKGNLNGGVISTLSQENISNYYLPIPPKNEQEQIAKYLDTKTTKIEQTITKNKQLITLLKEKRTSLINQTVTKGLNPDVPMKESGIEWIREIPEHWKINKLKIHGSIMGGYSFKSNDFTKSGIKVIKITNIQSMKFDWNEKFYLPQEYLIQYSEFKVKKNDIIFALTRPIISTGIKVAIYDENIPALLNQRTGIFKKNNKKLLTKFLFYIIYSDYFKESFKSKITTTNQPNISPIDIGEIKIVFPSKDEQIRIVEYLNNKTQIIDKTIEKVEKNIELLEEYKESLIHHVVTGKIDVRGVEL